MKKITYGQAIVEGLDTAMELDQNVFLMGQLVDYKGAIFNTTCGLAEKFGLERVMDFPNAECTMTNVAIGAACTGMRPVIIHPRLDFMMYSMDAIVNWLALWRFKSNGKTSLPVTIRAIVGKGWGQGPQHSKSMHSWFAHLPGLEVAMPATAFDMKGLLLESIFSENPTLIIESRALYSMKDSVPEKPYRVRFGEASIKRTGCDITIVALGILLPVAMRVADKLAEASISAEVIDPRTISPLDYDTICNSVKKTGRLLVADPGWPSCSIASELISVVCERLANSLKSNPQRICFPDSHIPMSYVLENDYYPSEIDFILKIKKMFNIKISE